MNPLRVSAAGLLALALAAGPGRAAQSAPVFGTAGAGEAAMVGILYDLKQTQDLRPTSMDRKTYTAVIDEFLAKNWDEGVLNRYYRASRPLYTTQIFIPMMGADAAPKAFGVQKIVKPRLWVVHYKAQVAPPSDGAWRFWGYGDDACCVAVNGKTVLTANRFDTPLTGKTFKADKSPGIPAGNGTLRPGDWIELKAGRIIDLDIIIGECPGGIFGAFLMIEKRGENYAKAGSFPVLPVLPVFQLAPYDTPAPKSPKDAPPFAANGPIWKAFQ